MKIGNYNISRIMPRGSTQFCKSHFADKEIDCAEVGVWAGENAVSLLENLNIRTLYAIDPFKPYSLESRDKIFNYSKIISVMNKAKSRLSMYEGQAKLLHTTSKEASNILNDLDFVYIDGNHDYKYVKEDLNLWWPKVRQGGVLAGHDVKLDDVVKAVIEFCAKENVIFKVWGEDWIIVKTNKTKRRNR